MMKFLQTLILFALSATISFSVLTSPLMAAQTTSVLYGEHGENWDPKDPNNRIPDFTEAGYKYGIVKIPDYAGEDVTKNYNVSEGNPNNTRELQRAIDEICTNGSHKTVYIPAGTYKFKHQIVVDRKNCQIKGAGPGENGTILNFTRGLIHQFPYDQYPKYDDEGRSLKYWAWEGAVILFKNTSSSGIRDLEIEFPDTPLADHHDVKGYNGLGFESASDSWFLNITIRNADMGIWVGENSHHITGHDWTLNFGDGKKNKYDHDNEGSRSGHHGLNVYGSYNLFSKFTFNGLFVHDISIESENSHHNVFMDGSGEDMNFDHHRTSLEKWQYNNLFTNIDIGQGSRIWQSGGSKFPRVVKNTVVWNIKSVEAVRWPTMNETDKWWLKHIKSTNNVVVGIKSQELDQMPSESLRNNWFEDNNPDTLAPQNLYCSQMEKQQRVKCSDILGDVTDWSSKSNWSAVKELGSNHRGSLITEFDVTPLENNIDGVIGYSSSSTDVSWFNSFNMIIRMNTNGHFDARNGGGYSEESNRVHYNANNTYHVKMETNLDTQKYSVWIDNTKIASDFSFRTDGPVVDDLGKVALKSNNDNDFKISNHHVTVRNGSSDDFSGHYKIESKHSGKVLDVAEVSLENGANVQQWNDARNSNQRWDITSVGNGYYKIAASHSGKFLGVSGSKQENGSNIIQWEDTGRDSQVWLIEPVGAGYVKILAKHSNKALDVAETSSNNGGNIHQWTYLGLNNQLWKLISD